MSAGVELIVSAAPAGKVATLLAEAEGAVVLSGGSTPRRAYAQAAKLRADWSGVSLWWGDERCVPPDDQRSNYAMVKAALLDHIEVQPEVHRIRGELGSMEAARLYDEELRGIELGLTVMGLGPDGHTASLFPNAPSLGERERRAVAAEPGLEPWVERVTLTLAAFATAGEMVFLVTGDDKADAARRAFREPPSPDTPASLTRGRRTVAYLDPAAATLLEPPS